MSGITTKIGIIGGTGLDNPDIMVNQRIRSVTTIFGDPSDSLIEGEIAGVQCVLLARHGRQHTIMPSNINYRANIWALKEAGCTHIVASTATGSLREEIGLGDLVVLDNFIDRTSGRKQTFFDGQLPQLPSGICHLPMEPAFCERTRQILIRTAEELEIACHKTGTVVAIEGPRFSSRAESHMHRLLGGSVVNMTSVPEVILAKEAGLCYAAIALATDYDSWRESGEKVSKDMALETFKLNADKVTRLLAAVVPKIAAENWDHTIQELHEVVENSFMSAKPH